MRTAQMSYLALVLALSACGGEFAYKQGAGADALSQDKQACQKSGQPYEACMDAKGWKVHKLDDDNPLAVFVTDTDPRANEQVYVPANKAVNTPVNASAGTATASPATAAGTVKTAQASAVTTAEKKSPPDPMTKFNVSSWWKQGAGAGDLNAGIDACVAKLGPAHAPEVEKKLYTRGLILCLKEQGWYGLQGY